MANKTELLSISLDIASFFLVTTELYGHQRLMTATAKFEHVLRYVEDNIGWALYATYVAVVIPLLSIPGAYLLIKIVEWNAGAFGEGYSFVMDSARNGLFLSELLCAIITFPVFAAIFSFTIVRKAKFQGLLLLTGTLLFLLEKGIAVASALDFQ
jgi:hypothetical protein